MTTESGIVSSDTLTSLRFKQRTLLGEIRKVATKLTAFGRLPVTIRRP
jgi:hypothetical protein